MRNYGIDEWPEHLPVCQRARWLADVMRRMIATLRANAWGSLRATSGSQAAYTHRRAYLTHALFCHAEQAALTLEGESYYGGRCEARRIGRVPGPVYHLDYRCQYGSVCAVSALPAVLCAHGESAGYGYPCGQEGEREVLGRVTIDTNEPAYPLRRDGLVIYPVGRFVTVLCGPELRDAQERGRIVSVHEWAQYTMLPALSAYAQGIYAQLERSRADGDTALCAWLKSLLVCIVGKMGQRGRTWRPYPGGDPAHPWETWYEVESDHSLTRCRSLGGQCQWEHVQPWSDHACPAVAAWITSAARVKLLNAIRVAGWHDVYYYDTDSLIVSESGYRRLVGASLVGCGQMGMLRLLDRNRSCRIDGIKHYRIGRQVKNAGIPRGVTERGPDGQHYWYRDWLARAVQGGRRPEVTRVLRKVARAGVYRHGRVGNGGIVYPFVEGG